MEFTTMTVAEYLWTRCRLLAQPYGNSRLNALPGDFALPLFAGALQAGMDYAYCCNEQEAAAAASGDARFGRFGFMLVTYGVGMKNVLGYISMDTAERHRTLYVSGASDSIEHQNPAIYTPGQFQLVHHYSRSLGMGDFSNQFHSVARMMIPTAFVNNPGMAVIAIDTVLENMEKFALPGYLEVPRSVARTRIQVPLERIQGYMPYWRRIPVVNLIDDFMLHFKDKIEETAGLIDKSKRPVIIAGSLVERYDLTDYVRMLAKKTGAPLLTTQMSFGLFSEGEPGYAGTYAGKMSTSPEIMDMVENSDCVIAIGTCDRETNSGLFSAKIDPKNLVSFNPDIIYIKGWQLNSSDFWSKKRIVIDTIPVIKFIGFFKGLAQCGFIRHEDSQCKSYDDYIIEKYGPCDMEKFKNEPVTVENLIKLINSDFFSPNLRYTADFGDCAMILNNLRIPSGMAASNVDGHMNTGFGFLLGAQPHMGKPRQSLLIIGDGAVNMNLGAFLTMKVRGVKGATIIILQDNCYKTLYLIEKDTERADKYNLHGFRYEEITKISDIGQSFRCGTCGELQASLLKAKENLDTNTLIVVDIDKSDFSPSLGCLAGSTKDK